MAQSLYNGQVFPCNHPVFTEGNRSNAYFVKLIRRLVGQDAERDASICTAQEAEQAGVFFHNVERGVWIRLYLDGDAVKLELGEPAA